jgi:hypothetical protein
MVAGEVAPIMELDQVAAALGVADRVHVLGFLPWGDFEAAIAACDLALNLRYPTAGETSASLLRILAAGRPAVVSDHAQMAELPDDVVVKVPVGDGERRMLAERLSALLSAPDRLAALGDAARRHVATRHRPADAADAVVTACAAFLDRDPAADGPRPVPPPVLGPPTSLAWHAMTGSLRVDGADAPWPPGTRRRLRVVLRNDSDAIWHAAERPAGGVALQTKLWVTDDGQRRDRWAERPWHGLPWDLGPGDEYSFALDLRRPLDQRVRLEILPHVLDHTGLPDLGGPSWEMDL